MGNQAIPDIMLIGSFAHLVIYIWGTTSSVIKGGFHTPWPVDFQIYGNSTYLNTKLYCYTIRPKPSREWT